MHTNLKRKNIKPLISIITIAKSNIEELKTTYESLKNLITINIKNIEWIVILSGNFGSLEKEISKKNVNAKIWHQEPRGIYFAMNTAIDLAEGKFTWFINAGDEIKKDNFKKLISFLQFSSKDLNFFPVLIKRGDLILSKNCLITNKNKLLNILVRLKMPPHHQGIVYKTKILKNNLFNKSFKIRGDYENLIRILQKKRKISISANTFPIAIFYEGGISNEKFIHYESLKILKENNSLKPISFVFFIYYFLKFNIKKLGKTFKI